MKVKTLKDIPNLKGKKVLLRVDFNVPRDENGEITDDTRIVQALDTINYLRLKDAHLIIMSHLGRPKGEVKEDLRLAKVAEHLEKLMKVPIKKMSEVLGENVRKTVSEMKDGDIIMLENVRFDKREEECDHDFMRELAALGEIFVNDAFGTAHRRHASTAGIADYLDTYSGLLIEREIAALSPILEGNFARPLTMIFGGAKIDTKIGVIRNFIEKTDYFLIGGGIANTFLFAAGYQVGQSLCEEDKQKIAREIMMECERNQKKLVLPHDVVVADEISESAETADIPIEDVMGDMKIFDIGKWSAEKFCNIIEKSGTVIWNGPVGLYEYEPFRKGTEVIANCIAKHDCTSIVGGGDTADAIKRLNIPAEAFTHISTGGGACIEFLEGKKLPGIEILKT